MDPRWPDLPFEEWADTRDTLHLWLQVVGKVKLALTPFLNEWWNVGLSLTARGLTTGPMPAGPVDIQIDVDFIGRQLVVATSGGHRATLDLVPRTVADFHAAVGALLHAAGVTVSYSTMPSEMPDPVPFERDTIRRPYDDAAALRWWQAMLAASRVIDRFRSPFGGKSSPVLFYWGGFDLNHTRFSGRPAPDRPGAGLVMALGEDQENFAVGFWPGSAAFPHAVLYAYPSPALAGMEAIRLGPGARWDAGLAEFVLPWEALITAADPDAAALDFFTVVYDRATELAGWDNAALMLARLPRRKAS